MIGVLVTFTQTDKFDRSTLAKIADEARGTFDVRSGGLLCHRACPAHTRAAYVSEPGG